MSGENTLFASLIERLLQGDILCQYSAEEYVEYLKDPLHQQEVDSFLRRMNRMLKTTKDESGYYAAYQNLDNPDHKLIIKRQFNEFINDIEPVIRWLKLTQSAQNSSAPLQPGDTLRESDLLAGIESAPTLIIDLERLSKTTLFKNSSTGPKKQLDIILKRLCEIGYLKSIGKSDTLFIATAKWSRAYEVLEFIATHEQLDIPDDEPTTEEIAF